MFLAVKEIQVIHCICSKVIDDKHRQAVCSAVSGYFAVNISFFCHYCIPFRSRSRPVFNGSGSGSGSEQTVSTAPAPAPAPTKMCRLRRLRLRLRLRLRIPDYNAPNHMVRSYRLSCCTDAATLVYRSPPPPALAATCPFV